MEGVQIIVQDLKGEVKIIRDVVQGFSVVIYGFKEIIRITKWLILLTFLCQLVLIFVMHAVFLVED